MGFLTDPLAWWVEPFTSYGFMRNALAAGILTAVITSLAGTWLVLRGMSFLGDALAHGVLPGIALAFVLDVNTTLGALVAALAMVLGVNLIRSRSPLPEDTSIGVLFVGFLALAVVIVSSQSGSYSGDLNRFLFGSITGVDNADLRRQTIAVLFGLAVTLVFFRSFLAVTFDEVLARMVGVKTRLVNIVMLALLAVSIVASFEAVGNLLVFGFLVAPPATASLLVRRVPTIMIAATAIGTVSVIPGLLISYHHDTAAGATMALVVVLVYIAVLFMRPLWHRLPGDLGSRTQQTQDQR